MLDLGKTLKEQRLEKGLSTQDIADKTKMSIMIIEALENGDLKPFSEDLTYVKYYVRSYCKAMDFDFEEVENQVDEAIVGYTQAITVLEEERKEELTKQIEEKKATIKSQSKNTKSGLTHKSGRLDWTLISLVTIVAVVFVSIIYAVFVKGIAKKDAPVEQPPVVENDNDKDKKPEEKPVVKPEEKPEVKPENLVKVEKIDPTTYEIYNWKDAKDFSIGIDFNVNTWIQVIKNDIVLADPESKVYAKDTSLAINKDLNENDKLTVIFGIMKSNVVKINNEVIELDPSIKDTEGRVDVVFKLMGDKE